MPASHPGAQTDWLNWKLIAVPRALDQLYRQLQSSKMADDGVVAVYNNSAITDAKKKNPFSIKVGLAQMLRGGVILEVTNVEQAKIAEEAGACAIVVIEQLQRGVRRMADPSLIKEIKRVISIPVMAKARVGHFVEAQILETIGVDYIDESEVLTPADDENHINKHNFRVPFVCGSRSLGVALQRVREGAAMVSTEGDASESGNIVETVRNVRSVMGEIRILNNMDDDEVFSFANKISAPYDLVAQTKQLGRLPVVHFAAGGIITPADAALMMQLGCDGVFVGSEVFNTPDPYKRARAIIRAVSHYNDPHVLAEISCGLADALAGLSLSEDRIERFGARGIY
ncbi:PREDICTED: probable pyridoxal 5'-phosphate synthase subunit PDX1 [Nelumbo nucifera]|uniref:PdxS/SNZ N-terminal domain-containing protein n=2 Tax=Nelumbo nucifera TaxID=4432 RepID=A0A822ZJ72_NELNU|nr:PREDICTED: probable pyridoxal 5'-phosphate synthase subunit PDX1 [Nelumbo nucifera]DAD44693.1 TPA_asm: hypothetical protein HUJ06_002923 [Nelumbo nucifera]